MSTAAGQRGPDLPLRERLGFVHRVQALWRIGRLRLDAARKRRLRRDWVRVFFLGRVDAARRRAELAGFQVSYCTFRSLYHLYRELFLGEEYRWGLGDSPRPFIVDCGSNIGLSVLYFKWMMPGAAILAFEPDPVAFSCLEENVRQNGLADVALRREAVAGADGELDFYVDPKHPGSLLMSSDPQRKGLERQTVSAVRLSRFLDRPVDLLELDVEGAELDVVRDLIDSGAIRHVRRLAIEYHHHVHPERDDLSRMLALLEQAGYGYQLHAALPRPVEPGRFQDILLFAYAKAGVRLDRASA